MIPVAGYCPMGCGAKLVVGEGGKVTCVGANCADPYRVHTILDDPRTDHLVFMDDRTFTLKHPLRERPEEMLFCDLHARIAALDGPPGETGVYTVRVREHDGTSESFRGDDHGLEFTRVDDLPQPG